MTSTDYAVFAIPEFDANEYANAILAGEPYLPQQPGKLKPPAATVKPSGLEPIKEDISVAISKLNFGVEDISKQLKNVVATHHEDLLLHAARTINLTGSLTAVRRRMDDLDASLEKLRLKIRLPYHSLQTKVRHLHQLQQASDVLRRASRFIVLARRLESQMAELGTEPGPETHTSARLGAEDHEDEKERTIAKAARSIAELVTLLDETAIPSLSNFGSTASRSGEEIGLVSPIQLRNVDVIAAHVPMVEEAQARVTTIMESMVLSGLKSLNQSLLASSFQTAHSLSLLPELVQSLLHDLSTSIEDRIRITFDVTQISKDGFVKDSQQAQSSQSYRSRIRTEPTSITAPQWAASLWSRLDSLFEDMSSSCVKVHTLEKVLRLKKDTVTQTVMLDEVMKVLENKPSVMFWTALGRALEKHAKDASKGSMFVQQTLSAGYPRLLRLFHEFFAKIAVHTDTVYTQAYQSPETVLVLRAFSTFESLYLSRSTMRLNEAVAQATRNSSSPGLENGLNIARLIVNELDSARFDPLLVRSVARGAAAALDGLISRAEGLVSRDRAAVSLLRPSATPQQVINGLLATCLYHCLKPLEKLKEEHTSATYMILQPSIDNLNRAYQTIIDPLNTAIRRELGAIIARLHRIDFGRPAHAMSVSGGGPSSYMTDLIDKLAFLKGEILAKFNVGDDARSWIMSIVTFVMRTFVLHVSIVKPLGESGKLQLTSDMTGLEFALSAFLVENAQSKRGGNLESVGDAYRALRAMRPLLFLENAQLANPALTVGLPPLVVLHHILVRSPISLPHSLHGWQEAEYVRWVDEHPEDETWALVESGLLRWEKMSDVEDRDPRDGKEYVALARTVLANARRAGST